MFKVDASRSTFSGYWLRRTPRNFALAACAALTVGLAYAATPPPDIRHRLSMATAYAGLAFLAASLTLEPWNVLRRKHNPVSFGLRRDVGIWAGLLALLHTGIGLTVHLRGRMWMYFFRGLHPLRLQNTQFGFANYTGLAAALILFLLLALSNAVALRSLGTRRWKSLQRWIYAAFGLTLLHGIAFQSIEKRHLPWVVLFTSMAVAVLILQLSGYVHVRGAEQARKQD